MLFFSRRLKAEQGFTIIEIISTLLVLGIVAVLALPRFTDGGAGVPLTAQVIRTDLRFAQKLAMARNPTVAGTIGITFTPGASSYSIPDTESVFADTRNLPSGITISSITISGNPTTNAVSYNRYGEPEFTGATASIVITDGSESATITIGRHAGSISIS